MKNTVKVTTNRAQDIEKLKEMVGKYPDQCQISETLHDGSMTVELPLEWLEINADSVIIG